VTLRTLAGGLDKVSLFFRAGGIVPILYLISPSSLSHLGHCTFSNPSCDHLKGKPIETERSSISMEPYSLSLH
jgi:hypothetical protein